MKHKLLNYFCLFFILAFVAGCEDKEDIFTPKTYNVSGKVEKGPFINGSKITAQALDKNYNLTGEVYQGVITVMTVPLISVRLFEFSICVAYG